MFAKRLIKSAEGQWLYVFYAGKKTRHRAKDGAPLELLPPRFESRRKIYRFFSMFWGKRLATQMLKNLPLKNRHGRLYVIAYDAGPMSVVVRKIRILCQTKCKLTILTQLTGGPEGRVYVVHSLVKSRAGRYVIARRTGPAYDFRYYKPQKHRARIILT